MFNFVFFKIQIHDFCSSMTTLNRAIKKKKVHGNLLPLVAASSSAYSFRERPLQKDVTKSQSSVHTKVFLEKAPSSSSMLNSRNGNTGDKKRGRPAADTASAPNDTVFEQEMEGIPEVMEEDIAVSSNNCVPEPMDDISKNSNLPGPMEEIFVPEENEVIQDMNDNISQPENDTVSASMSVNASHPKKDDGTTRSSLIPKSKSFNVAEMRAMIAEWDADKFKSYQQTYRMETQLVKNAYRLKYIAMRTAANPHDLSVFTEPPIDFEVKERDRIFSATFSAFQPKNIFEDSDDEEEEAK
uniref:Uncharacterized protein n=1 Tax=Panagrolaimus sp. ES5 TaxID=591445 RepID=A0AC34GNL2_9BILA